MNHPRSSRLAALLCVIFYTLFHGLAHAAAAEQPPWQDLQALLGRSTANPQLTTIIRKHELKSISKGSDGSYFPEGHGYSIMFSRNIVDTIVLRARGYENPLPAGLVADDDRASVLRKLGAPKGDPKFSDVWVHGGLEIWVHFTDIPGTVPGIAALYVSTPELKNPPKTNLPPLDLNQSLNLNAAPPN